MRLPTLAPCHAWIGAVMPYDGGRQRRAGVPTPPGESQIMHPRIRRRSVLGGVARAAGVLLAGPVLAGCDLSPVGALNTVRQYGIPQPLTVCLAEPAWGSGPYLADLSNLLFRAVAKAHEGAPAVGNVTYQTTTQSNLWFPSVGMRTQYVDDPSIPMPDVVVYPHRSELAVRALDLRPYVELESGALEGIPPEVLRQGRAYVKGHGMIQASLPLLRIPLLCLVAPGIRATEADGSPWKAQTFTDTLDRLKGNYPSPNGPLAVMPWFAGAANMAVVGSGGRVAQGGPEGLKASFGDAPAVGGLTQALLWTDRQVPPYDHNAPPDSIDYGVLMYHGGPILDRGAPFFRGRPNQALPPAKGWTIAPVPAFPHRFAVPTANVDVMVFRHTRAPKAAAELAAQLLSREVQEILMTYRGALALRPDQALTQLTKVIGNVQAPKWIADPTYDITFEDVYGTLTDRNAMDAARASLGLSDAILYFCGGVGEIIEYFAAPDAWVPLIADRAQAQRPLVDGLVRDVLHQAQADANQGLAFPGGTPMPLPAGAPGSWG